MFVCICNAVTDHQIKETIAAGATTMGDLQSQLGVANNAQPTVTAGINVQA